MVPRVRLHTQPSDDEDSAGKFLREVLTDDGISSVTIVAAWVRYRGLGRLKSELEAFRQRGDLRIILGIDEGGATRPGLYGALRSFDEAYVYHRESAGTFHPKLYFAEGPAKARLFVGSSNVTPGGLFLNDEASLEAEFELPADADEEALVGTRTYIERLLADSNVCLELRDELIERLVNDPRYRVSGHERRTRPTQRPLPEGAEDEDVEDDEEPVVEEEAAPIFGASERGRSSVPPLSQAAKDELAELEIAGEEEPEAAAGGAGAAPPASPPGAPPPAAPAPPPPPPPAPSPATVPVPVLLWRKRLPATDAQHQVGNPTSNVRLTKARQYNQEDIPHMTWFRNVLFGSASWTGGSDGHGNPTEVAPVTFDVTIDGVHHGAVELEVDHAPHRISDQANHATVLHWGGLEELLRRTNYTGRMLEIAQLSDGSFRLAIA